jgi:small subunit ribosomal protein S11
MAEEETNKPEATPAPEAAEAPAEKPAEKPAEAPAPEAKTEEAPAEAKAGEAKPAEAKAGEAKPAEGGEEAKAEDGKAEEGEKKDDKKPRDIFAEIAGAESEEVKIHKAKKSKHVTKGIVHITATFNNTVVCVTDTRGNAIGWSTSGKMGFKGSRKSTAYAAQIVSQDACRQAMGHGLKEAEVRVKGPGSGREAAVRAVQAIGIDITNIQDVTPIPHNGCRPKKARRV